MRPADPDCQLFLWALCLLVTFGGVGTAAAQPPAGCRQAGISVGASLGIAGVTPRLDPEVTGASSQERDLVRAGLVASAMGELGFTIVGVRLEIGGARLGVDRERYRDSFFTDRESVSAAGHFAMRRITAGISVRTVAPRRVCGHASIGAGFYRLTYGDLSLRANGLSAVAGLDYRLTPHSSIVGDLVVDVIGTRSRPPTLAYLTIQMGVQAGLLFRF